MTFSAKSPVIQAHGFGARSFERETGARTCYVNVGQAPSQIFRALRDGRYPAVTPADARALVSRRSGRFGAYGDPGAAPTAVWANLARSLSSWTGYTHQWRRRPSLRPYCMASVDTPLEQLEARSKGWRTFRVRRESEGLSDSEIPCPASETVGCVTCRLCSGTTRGDLEAVQDAAARREARILLAENYGAYRTNGAILWEGPSRLDGSPIAVIVTGLTRASSNAKTGAMLQTWILRTDMHPLEAIATGADSGICGDCPHRGAK